VRRPRSTRIGWAIALVLSVRAHAADPVRSTCYGTPEKGRLEDSVALPSSGANFRAYSSAGVLAGRTYVHSIVRDVVVAAYDALAKELPGTVFVYGETSWRSGGSFRPHKTHQNGTSVDFMVPVRDASGASVPLPGGPLDKFGYGIEFDATGRHDELAVDFPAVTAHLRHLDREARSRGVTIRRVILCPEFVARLKSTPRWKDISGQVPFSTKKPWVRHDEHYHVDFAVACEPYRAP